MSISRNVAGDPARGIDAARRGYFVFVSLDDSYCRIVTTLTDAVAARNCHGPVKRPPQLHTTLDGAEPATSSLLAIDIARQRSGHLPDLLVSGINSGANIGAFTQISGTVGAAIVAMSSTFNGAVPAIAISTDAICTASTPECNAANDEHFARVARFTVNVIAQLEQKSGPFAKEAGLLPRGLGLNINYPPIEVPVGVRIAQQGRTAAFGGATSTLNIGCYGPCASVPVGTALTGGITGIAADDTPEVRNADTTAFLQGYVTIVPIEANYTADPAERLNAALNLKSLLTEIAN